ncbi:MAG TPA: hypothetical protein PK360_21140, partial [bacterium]|nr:hypothetical protein [bacterium]
CRTLKMQETAAYGVYITNREYSKTSALGLASQVTIQPASPIIIRSCSPPFFRAGRPVRVRLDVINPGPKSQDMVIEENLPPGWKAVRTRREGQIQGHRIIWPLRAPPGSTALEYEAVTHDPAESRVVFSGAWEGHPLFGETRVYPVLREARGESAQQWRYWKSGEDFDFQDLERISLNPRGIVFAEDPPGGRWFRLDGYSISSLPAPEGREMVRESASGRIWSVSFTETAANPSRILTGFQEYRDDRWIFHGLEGPYLSGLRSFLLNGNEEILVLLQEKLVSWSPATRVFQLIRRADETSLSAFGEMAPAGDGSVWIGGPEGLVFIQAEEGNVHPDSLWMDHPLDPQLNARDVQKMTA